MISGEQACMRLVRSCPVAVCFIGFCVFDKHSKNVVSSVDSVFYTYIFTVLLFIVNLAFAIYITCIYLYEYMYFSLSRAFYSRYI